MERIVDRDPGCGANAAPAGKRRVRWMRRLSTQIAIGQILVLLVVIGLDAFVNGRLSEHQIVVQYERRAQAVAQSVASLPQVVAALDGRGPRSAVQPLALRIAHSTGAEFVVVVDRSGIRLSSQEPALVGKSFHEPVVSLDGRVHLRIDPGKPYPNAQARVPVFGRSRRIVGEVSVGFLESEVASAARRALPSAVRTTLVALPLGVLGALLLAWRLKRITLGLELDQITELARHRERLAQEQAALHRVAKLVAEGRPQEEIFSAIVTELFRIVDVDLVQLLRYEGGVTAVRLAGVSRDGSPLPPGEAFPVAGHNVVAEVWETARPARIDDPATITGGMADFARRTGMCSVVGCPIVVDGETWAVIAASRTRPEPMPPDTESRIAALTELAATAIANAQAREALSASRRRIVSAADDMRRQIERNLHDGAQQRLVVLSIELAELSRDLPAESDLATRVHRLQQEVESVRNELRVLSRGLHPAILSRGGLGPAIRALARTASLPVELAVEFDERLPEAVEVTAYYVAAEAITNATKHAGASRVWITLGVADGELHLCVRDDGVGGASESAGSGLIGLRDRVSAGNGRMSVKSPPGAGTTIDVELPLSIEGVGDPAELSRSS